MKKSLLSLAVLAGLALSAQAAPIGRLNSGLRATEAGVAQFSAVTNPNSGTVVFKAPQKEDAAATDSYTLTYAESPYYALGLNGTAIGDKVGQFMEMTPTNTTELAGNQIAKFQFYTGLRNGTQMNYVNQYSFIIIDGADGKTVLYEQAYTITTGTEPFALNTITLDAPFTIEAGKDYLVGCYGVLRSPSDMTIVTDGAAENQLGGIVGMVVNGAWNFLDLVGSGYGTNCIAAIIEGDNLPMNSISIEGIDIVPTAKTNTPYTAEVYFANRAANDVESVELTYTLGTNAPVTETFTLATPLKSNKEGYVTIEGLTYANEGTVSLVVSLDKVNGEANTSASPAGKVDITFLENGFTKNVVCEEFTGTWCGYCPQGIVGIETMMEEVPAGTFIPVAIHINSDPMRAKSWTDMVDVYSDGSAPASVVNRTYSVFPVYDYLRSAYYYVSTIASLANVNAITAKWAAPDVSSTGALSYKVLDVNVSAEFAINLANSPYQLAFAVTENEVGPYNQTNNYAGGQLGEMGGWEKLGSSVKTIYNDVARYLDGFPGLEGSLPSKVEKGTVYEYTHTIDTSSANIRNRDGKHCDVVVYIVNSQTGVIENARVIKAEEIELSDVSAIEDVIAGDDNAPVEYFTIEGRRVDNPANGLYIRRQGNKVEKVVL